MCSGLDLVSAWMERKAAVHASAAVVFARTCQARPLNESFATATSILCSIPTAPRSKCTCYFVTDNFITSQRLDAALQHHTLHVMAGLPPALQPWVHE